jgi:hypothetical protein
MTYCCLGECHYNTYKMSCVGETQFHVHLVPHTATGQNTELVKSIFTTYFPSYFIILSFHFSRVIPTGYYGLNFYKFLSVIQLKHPDSPNLLYLTVVVITMKKSIIVCWDMPPCTSEESYQHFREICCLHVQAAGIILFP